MLERWSPMAELDRMLDEVDRRLGETIGRSRVLPRIRLSSRPAVDLYDTGDALILKAELPGAAPADIDIALERNTVTLRGRTGYAMSEEEARRLTWYRREITTGSFIEVVDLPVAVDADAAVATFDNGMLTLTLPKAEQVRVRHIAVRTPGASDPSTSAGS